MTEKQFDPKMLNALDLAFVGDGVYGLLVREMLAKQGSRPVGELHRMAVEYVNATAQAAAYDRIAPMLTEQEQAVFRRGRNGGAHPPRNADLHLCGEQQRLRALFAAIVQGQNNE